jgi:signal peptidase I
MEASFLDRHPHLRDVANFFVFMLVVFIGTVLINTFIFRSFSVTGHSMDNTLADGERLIVNRIPLTSAQFQNKSYSPERGQIIVFKNPRFIQGERDEYIVKRVIAFAGERVTVDSGVLTVYNEAHPQGFQPDNDYRQNGVGPKSPVSGDGVDMVVPSGTIFVCGDNRTGNMSYDSRSGLGTIPIFDIVGPVAVRLWPFTKFTVF